MYGFLPCSSNVPSHIFLIVIYEYLLYHGESYAGGDGRIFRVLGKNFYVAMFSQLLDSLPESLILLGNFSFLCSPYKDEGMIFDIYDMHFSQATKFDLICIYFPKSGNGMKVFFFVSISRFEGFSTFMRVVTVFFFMNPMLSSCQGCSLISTKKNLNLTNVIALVPKI